MGLFQKRKFVGKGVPSNINNDSVSVSHDSEQARVITNYIIYICTLQCQNMFCGNIRCFICLSCPCSDNEIIIFMTIVGNKSTAMNILYKEQIPFVIKFTHNTAH